MIFRSRTVPLLILLFAPTLLFAADADIVINEIAAYESSDYEWIEIYNRGAAAVDITGWKFFEANTNHKLTAYRGSTVIEPGTYAVIANKADKVGTQYPNFTGTLIDSSWSSLSESGESIGLKNINGETVELFTYIEAKNASLERKNFGSADYTFANWSEHASGNTIGVQNSNASSQQQSQQQASQRPAPGKWRPHRGSVLINELVSDPTDRQEEWIELINTTQQSIKLEGWVLEDGNGTTVVLSGELGIREDERYATVGLSMGFLDNAGDRLFLKSVDQVIIDEVTYGVWDDGDVRDNAPRAVDPFSLARVGNTFSNRYDFHVTSTPTKGGANKITSENVEEQKSPLSVIISEAMPNPASRDSADEFVELYNPQDIPVSLGGWELILLNDMKYVFPSGEVLAPREYRIYPRTTTNLSLANSGGERIRLYAPYVTRYIDEVRYAQNAPLQMSYARKEDGVFYWTKTPTPSAANIITEENSPPSIVIHGPHTSSSNDPVTLDASDTFDRDGDTLMFTWDFGDGTTGSGPVVHHQYHDEDAFSALLTVSDGKTSAAQFHHIEIRDTPYEIDTQVVSTSDAVAPVSQQKTEKKSKEKRNTSLLQKKNNTKNQSITTTELSRVRSLPVGAHVRVEGIVSAPPGLISENYFYIAGSGIQVWNPKKLFPKFERGDRIAVEGTVRKNGVELAIRIDGMKAVTILGHEEELIPHEAKLSDIGESLEGTLVRVAGTVADMRWPNMYLEEDDVRIRLYAAKSTGIDKDSAHKGDTITATGIVSETSAGYRILLRDQNDIVATTAPSGQVLGEKTYEGQVLTLPERQDPKKGLFRYFLVTLIATIITLGGLAVQYYLDRIKSK